jgi:hypothetical protein
MAINYDLALENNDLMIVNGDFFIAESDEQHIIDNISAFPGWWKENPADGVGILQYQNASGSEQEIAKKIKIELQSDGYQVTTPSVYFDASGELIINPNATKV